MSDDSASTRRFSSRVADYVRWRPGYPPGLILTLKTEVGLGPGSRVADIGSGTGISAKLFLGAGCTVHAVEPNADMRRAAEDLLGGHHAFHSADGSAESTGLPDRAFDLVAAGQAFHWFDPAAARVEFLRILKPGAPVALFWNTRLVDVTPFLREYEDLLLRFGTDYAKVDHRQVDTAAVERFLGAPPRRFTFPNEQVFGFDGVRGRLLSSSYVPAAGEPGFDAMLADAEAIFRRHERDGAVSFLYETELYLGPLRG